MFEYTTRLDITITTYHYDPRPPSASISHTDSLPSPRTSFRFEWGHPSDSELSISMDTLLLGDIQLDHVVYFKLSSPPALYTSPAVAQELGATCAGLISRCSPLGLQTLELYGSSLSIFAHILTSWSHTHSSSGDATHPTIAIHNHNHDYPSLFCFIRTLFISSARRFIRLRRQAPPPDMGYLLDVLEEQADLYSGSCAKFSELVLQRCTIRRGTLTELVDSISSVIWQRDRFTRDPPHVPYEGHNSPPPFWPMLPSPVGPEHLPDADLDWPPFPPQFHNNLPNLIPQGPVQHAHTTWVHHVRLGRITFDFRGSSGIRVDQNVDPLGGFQY
ncbi:hypothetical protein QCA50_006241 [Cerrena zonata]|uniref:Uncharacterized protein n=1 Tax=Cerrena zonata TaxID=2478898 RepID=A0AAW0GCG5_9APHY